MNKFRRDWKPGFGSYGLVTVVILVALGRYHSAMYGASTGGLGSGVVIVGATVLALMLAAYGLMWWGAWVWQFLDLLLNRKSHLDTAVGGAGTLLSPVGLVQRVGDLIYPPSRAVRAGLVARPGKGWVGVGVWDVLIGVGLMIAILTVVGSGGKHRKQPRASVVATSVGLV